MDQPKIYNNPAELKADVRSVVLTELAEICGQELSEDDILALARLFRGWKPETNKSRQLELERLRGRLEYAVSYGNHEEASNLDVWIRALEMRATAAAGKREYPLPPGP